MIDQVVGNFAERQLTGNVPGQQAQPGLAQDFQAMLDAPQSATKSVVNFVDKAEKNLKLNDKVISSKLSDFGSNGQVMSLIDAMHQSSLRSISVQLSSKVGSKVSESFEQLVKQQ